MKPTVVLLKPMSDDFKKDFQEALSYHLYSIGWGAESRLAREIGCSPQYIGQLRKGEKAGSEKKRQAIAKHFGFTYQEFLDFGKRIRSFKSPNKANSAENQMVPASNQQYQIVVEQLTSINKAVGAISHRLEIIEKDVELLKQQGPHEAKEAPTKKSSSGAS